MTINPLFYYLSQIDDFRIRKGRRHRLGDVLGMVVMAVLSGRTSIKSINRFIQQHEKELTKLFDTKHGVPAYGTLRDILTRVAFEELNKALFSWTNQFAPFGDTTIISADGKALRSTVSDGQSTSQNFVYLVSLYDTTTKLVYSASVNENKKDNEAEVVRDMFTRLKTEYQIDITSVSARFDALHCQKKQ